MNFANGTAFLVAETPPNAGDGIPANAPAICLVKTGTSTSVYEKTGALATDWTLISGGGGGSTSLVPLASGALGANDTYAATANRLNVIDCSQIDESLPKLTVTVPLASSVAAGTLIGIVFTTSGSTEVASLKARYMPLNTSSPGATAALVTTGGNTIDSGTAQLRARYVGDFILLASNGATGWNTVAASLTNGTTWLAGATPTGAAFQFGVADTGPAPTVWMVAVADADVVAIAMAQGYEGQVATVVINQASAEALTFQGGGTPSAGNAAFALDNNVVRQPGESVQFIFLFDVATGAYYWYLLGTVA